MLHSYSLKFSTVQHFIPPAICSDHSLFYLWYHFSFTSFLLYLFQSPSFQLSSALFYKSVAVLYVFFLLSSSWLFHHFVTSVFMILHSINLAYCILCSASHIPASISVFLCVVLSGSSSIVLKAFPWTISVSFITVFFFFCIPMVLFHISELP